MLIYNRMVVDERTRAEQTDLLFHALSDATRRDIVRLVLDGEHSVSDLASRYPMSFAAVQKHVAVLERADLITKHQRGRERFVRGRIDAVREVNRLLDELETIWRDRMQRFGNVLAESESGSEAEPDTEPRRKREQR
ncbi:MAG: putative ArsR-family transcriptional regulator match [Ilumatobacteraceae bacterium]|nr:putative ArsR-family transcriptional regulator match [Ilumatobacteraceae bacterium]